jgi:hypothetical protein
MYICICFERVVPLCCVSKLRKDLRATQAIRFREVLLFKLLLYELLLITVYELELEATHFMSISRVVYKRQY